MKQFVSVTIYDAYGKVAESATLVARADDVVVIPLQAAGVPPFLVAGDRHICAAWAVSTVSGADAAAVIEIDPAYDEFIWLSYRNVTVDVPAGSLQGERVWQPPNEIWNFRQLWMEPSINGTANPNGAKYGALEMLDPDGDMIRYDRVGPLGRDARVGTMQKMPGDYLARVVLDSAWPVDSSWTYTVKTYELDASACAFGFMWTGICTDSD